MSRDSFLRYLSFAGTEWRHFDAGAAELNVGNPAFHGGARGNGITDDRAAIQAAIDAAGSMEPRTLPGTTSGGVVRLPAQCTFLLQKPTSGTATLTAKSNVSILGSGPSSILKLADGASNGTTMDVLSIGSTASKVYIDNLTIDGNGTNQTGTSRGILLNGCSDVTIGPNVRILNAKTRSIAGANSPKNITIGAAAGHVDAKVLGVLADGTQFSTAAVTSGSNQVTVTGATAAMNGLYFEVESAGAADGLVASPGWRNLVGFAKFVSSTRLDMYSDAALTTVLNAGHTVTTSRAVVGTDNHLRVADMLTLSTALGGVVVDYPAGTIIQGQETWGNGTVLRGQGAGVTFVRAKTGSSAFVADSVGNIQMRGMTVDGYGPDGGSDGITYKTSIYISNCTKVLLEDVTCRNGHNGFSIRDQQTDDVTLIRCRAENMLTSNGTYYAGTTGGLGFWFFNGTNRVKLFGCVSDGTDRHGIYFDPGASDKTAAGHAHHNTPVGVGNQVYNAARSGIGVGFGLQGVRWGSFGATTVDTVGKDPVALTYSECEGLYLGGDQNGEYPQWTEVTGLTMKDIGGIAVSLQGVGCHIQGTVDGFNAAQGASSVAPVYINSYPIATGFENNVLAGNDPSYNTVELVAHYRGADAAKYAYAAVFTGGTTVQNGSGGTRTAQCLGNVVKGRFTLGTSTPATAMGSWVGGADCPSTGVNANVVLGGQAYTTTNAVVNRSYNANATTVDDLADVMATLLADLRGLGFTV